MTHEQDQAMLAQVVADAVKRDGSVDVQVADLESIGLGLTTMAYADWLRAHRLRMWPPRAGLVRLTSQTQQYEKAPLQRTHEPDGIPTRPECWGFAMDFLGEPEAPQIEAYVEALEAYAHRLKAELNDRT